MTEGALPRCWSWDRRRLCPLRQALPLSGPQLASSSLNNGASVRCSVGCDMQGWVRPGTWSELWGAATRQQAAGLPSSHGLPWSGPKPERALPRPVLGPGAGETRSVRHQGPACAPGCPALFPEFISRCSACSLPAGRCSKHCTTSVHASRRPPSRDCYSSCLTEEETGPEVPETRLAVQGSASRSTGAAPGPEWLPLVEAHSTAALGCPPTSLGGPGGGP